MKRNLKNPIAVFLFSIDHKSKFLNKLFAKIGLYNVIQPFPFEHYCVFCAKYVSFDWWRDKSYYMRRLKAKMKLEMDMLPKEAKP